MFTYGVTYLMLFVLVSTAVLQISYLNSALARFDSTQVIPTNFVLFTTSSIVGSAILFNDFAHMNPTTTSFSLAGIACMFMGVQFITGSRPPPSHAPIPTEDPSAVVVGTRTTQGPERTTNTDIGK
ncbi:hypothetical protein HK102_012517, partial [Quaeritorhiza haematococci]